MSGQHEAPRRNRAVRPAHRSSSIGGGLAVLGREAGSPSRGLAEANLNAPEARCTDRGQRATAHALDSPYPAFVTAGLPAAGSASLIIPCMFRILLWRRANLADMETGSARRVLAVKRGGPWLVLVNGTTWNVESRNAGVDTPGLALLPLLERPRDEGERLAGQVLGPGDPDIAQVLHAVIQCGLSGPSEYWISRALAWMINDEVGLFAGLLREIAVGRSSSQATQHAAKRLLKQNGHWPIIRRQSRS